MRIIRILCVCMVMMYFMSFVNLSNNVDADALGPEITNIYHTPKYPIYPETVTVYATVTDPDDVKQVDLIYCDEGQCYMPITMTQIGSSDVYNGTIPLKGSWGNGTRVGYKIQAEDNLDYQNYTKYIYFFYVSAINLSTEIQENPYVGDTLFLNGTAFYDDNESLPVEYSAVTVSIIGNGDEYNTNTDKNGNFSIEPTFDTPGEFQINTTVSNRTLAGYHEIPITVFPLYISYVSEILHLTTCYPDREIWVNGTARYNSGKPVVYSDIEVRINETLSWTGQTGSIGNYSILITAPSEIDEYTVTVTVVNASLLCYNETSLSVTEKPLPDLVVYTEEITFVSDNTPPLEEDDVNITVIVHNSGSALVEEVNVSFYVDNPATGQLIGSVILSQIAIEGTDTANITWNAGNGTHHIWVVVDPLDTIIESFEDNNNASKPIFVDNDSDGDGIGDKADRNDDNDAYLDEDDAFPYDPTEWRDSDGDGIGNNADEDDDNDGLSDEAERVRRTDPLNPDTDGDGVNDKNDYYPLDPDKWEETLDLLLLVLLILIIVIIVMPIVVFLKRRKTREISPPTAARQELPQPLPTEQSGTPPGPSQVQPGPLEPPQAKPKPPRPPPPKRRL